ncbi:MAG: DsbE family thiol:disulfide interchange protein [Rhodospirillales bacterium]|nr:DsbE family thiol:disulfide interchange protein [Rhodospirillales bacterium]
MKRLFYFLPVAVFLVLAVYFAVGLTLNPKEIPSVLINKPVPPFDLKPIKGYERGFSSEDLKGQVSLVNIWGSWCTACLVEHPFLMKIKHQGLVPIYGIDWREQNRDDGPRWLEQRGDPYTLIGDDPDSKAAIAFGVTGAPETFIVDQDGIIRYKRIGIVDEEIWNDEMWPVIQHLRQEKKDMAK